MRKRLPLVLVFLLLIPALASARNYLVKKISEMPPVFTGMEDTPANLQVAYPPYDIRETDGTDLLGDTVTVGTTWYDYQHNGNIGRMIVKDDSGYIHIVWMNGLNEGSSDRHVYYNYIDPQGNQGWPGIGYPVETSTRAGYTCLAVGWGGLAFPAFHQIRTPSPSDPAHSAVATDFFPHAGAFLTYELPWFQGEDIQYIWPRIAMKQDGEMVVLSNMYDQDTHTWSLGTYDPLTYSISYTDQMLFDECHNISEEVGASHVSNRIGAAWSANANTGASSWLNSDLHVMVDNDGLNLNFDNWWNGTNFIAPDTTLLPDSTLANGDTLRAFTCSSLFFDMNDVCHIAFTTRDYFQLQGFSWVGPSLIWHWSELAPDEYQLIADGSYWPYGNPGNYAVNVQRPSLGQDPQTGYLYCMYQVFDTTTISAAGFASGEIYVSVSLDDGFSWAVGTNITNTVSPENALPGECLSEGWPSMAERVDGYCHITYILDLDAGGVPIPEGAATLNPVKYHKVPVELINTSPLIEQIPFHVEHLPDTTQVHFRPETVPSEFALYQNAPNPFNPTTTIRFSLETLSDVNLSVFNLRGERVAVIASGPFPSGTHTVGFDGRDLASGMYVYRLEADGKSLEKKMLLIK